MLALAAILGLVSFVGCEAHANDGAFHGEGATVFAYKEHRVRMVSEDIRIRYAPSEAHPRAAWEAAG